MPTAAKKFRYKMELTLFTHTAMNGTYGESFIVYNPQYQELKINSSYTKQKRRHNHQDTGQCFRGSPSLQRG